MHKTILITILATTLLTNTANAEYYAQDYDPSYLPYNFEEAVEADYPACDSILAQYDDIYDELDSLLEEFKKGNSQANRSTYVANWETAPKIDDQRIQRFSQLQSVVEEEIRKCLIEYREWEEEQEEIAEAEARKEAAEKYELEQQAKLQKALEECNFEYFETLSNDKKIATYDERKACEDKTNEPDPVEIIPITAPVQPTTQYILPAPTTVAPHQTEDVVEDEIEEVTEDTNSTSTEATTTDEVIEITQEELDRIVEEKLNEKLKEAEPEATSEPEPSVFKKVINFFLGWLWN